jgi:hypothetical protein
MKARIVAVALVGLGCYSAIGQEYDDVYFSRKDRDKQQALAPKTLKNLDKSSEDYPVLAKANRKVEGYTGRTINPDYQSKYSTGTEVSSYFVPNYQPRVANSGFNSMYTNNGCYSCFNNNWGMRNQFGYGMNSPFYSPFSSSWGYSPYGYNNYWNDPWNNYGYNSWNSWGNPYSSWGNPYYGYGMGMGMGLGYSYYGSGWGGGYYGGWNNYYVTNNNPDNNTPRTYGKRSSRNDGVVNNGSMSRGSQVVSGGQNTNPSRGGRVATTSGSTNTGSRYYQRGWRQDPTINPAANTSTGSRSSGWVGSGNSGRSTSTWGNMNNGSNRSNSWNNDTFGGSRSSGSSFSTGGSRSSGSSFGGGSSGGGSRSSGGSSSGTRGRN